MGINKKKIILNILIIGILSSMATTVTCSAEQNTITTTTNSVAQNNENPSIIKKLNFEHDLQDILNTYKNLKETEKAQAKNSTMDLLESIINSDKYSYTEKKSILQETVTIAIANSIFEYDEGLKVLGQVHQEVEKQSNIETLDNTIENILNSKISINGKSNFCKNTLILAKANGTLSEEEYENKLNSLESSLNQLQKEEDERIAKEKAEQLAKEEQARKEEEARRQAELKAQEEAQRQAEEQARIQAEQEKIYQKAVQQTTDTTVDTSTLQHVTTQEQYYEGFSGTLQYTDKDFLALCNAVEHEVGNCSTQSKKMVASVIINRALSGKFPSSMYDVITQANQFTGISAYVNRTDYASEDTKYWCQYVLDNGIDFASGALFYYAPQWCGYMSYFEDMTLVAECDGQRYFIP